MKLENKTSEYGKATTTELMPIHDTQRKIHYNTDIQTHTHNLEKKTKRQNSEFISRSKMKLEPGNHPWVQKMSSGGVWGCPTSLTTYFFLFIFILASSVFHRGRTDRRLVAIGPDGSNCFWRRSMPVFLRKPIATCDFPGWDQTP